MAGLRKLDCCKACQACADQKGASGSAVVLHGIMLERLLNSSVLEQSSLEVATAGNL
jgi:hypothetical protein